jgi:ABC-type Zn uptake system ZnuABC Zn-binding protein ZnuA
VRTILKTFVVAGLVVLAGCGADEKPKAAATVVATTPQVADMARAVAGRRAQVTQILRPGIDAHEFEPRPSDARAVAEADVLVASGGELDDWVGEIASAAGFMGERLTVLDEIEPASQEDPHWWQDPRKAVRAVGEIERLLVRADPRGRATYESNARAYTARLRRMDRSIAACVARVPAAQRNLVTTHDAFGYYARRYGIHVVGALIPSLSTQAQPSGRDVERLVDQMRAERVKAIFPETALNPRLERAVSREAGVRVGPGLWADTLGPPGSPGGTYLGSLAVNTARLVDGMSGGRVRCRPTA